MNDDQLDNISLFKHFCHKTTDLTSTEKLVAVILMSHRNNISMMCCPGLTLIAKETGFNRRTIQKAILSLIEKKEIVKLRITNEKIYLRSQYYFLYDISAAMSIYENEESCFNSHHGNEVDNFEFCLARKWF